MFKQSKQTFLIMEKFEYNWTLAEANFTKDKGKVFSCFACGGGSTMGYKLAGFDVFGCNEIDPKMMEAYKANHDPKYSYLEPIQEFKLRKDLPKELYNLDILDGSPPCSSFSMVGNRDKNWGKEKKFREGQAEQILDTLFFDFIDLAKELQPKVVVAENVTGLMMGNAKSYVRKIYKQFDEAGYYCQHWILDASTMGVPQRRKRVFFICLRKDLANPFLHYKDMFTQVPKLSLNFKEKPIPFSEFAKKYENEEDDKMTPSLFAEYDKIKEGETSNKYFQFSRLDRDKVPSTLTTAQSKSGACQVHPYIKRYFNNKELCLIGSYPLDYDFSMLKKPIYLIGMSVPPVMVAKIASQIYNQWLSKI
jgi:DNA (cytosine-5)-methyltransferase 1